MSKAEDFCDTCAAIATHPFEWMKATNNKLLRLLILPVAFGWLLICIPLMVPILFVGATIDLINNVNGNDI